MIECMICNKKFKRITNTHLKHHSITCEEYMERYPTAPMITEELRSQISIASFGKTYEERYGKETASKLKQIRKASAVKQFSDIEQRRIRFQNNWKGFGDLSGDHWKRIVEGAKSRNLPLEVTIEDVWILYEQQNGLCALSGIPIFLRGQTIGMTSKEVHKKTTASLDRIDSTEGYVHGNLQWIHKDLNQMKSNRTQDEFLEWVRKVYSYNHN